MAFDVVQLRLLVDTAAAGLWQVARAAGHVSAAADLPDERSA